MSFLHPWLWIGALALGAPIWLHLRRRQETNVVEFTALRFLEDEPEPRSAPMRLRDILLFLARMCALLLIVTGFTWPYLRGANTVPIKESRVYILDNTMSHQVNNGFTTDRDRILTELSRAGTDIQIAVIELSASPRVLMAFGDDRQSAKEKLEQLQPSFQRGAYLAAFRQANSLLANSLGSQKRIVFMGDNQENQWNENVSTPPFLRDVQIDLPKTQTGSLPNLSLSEPRAQRVFLGDKSLVHFTAKLAHTGEAKSANIVLLVNGQTIFNRPIDLEKQPEVILLQAQWDADPSEWLQGEISVDGTPDALAADNKVVFSLPPVVEGKLTLLAQSPYLRLALSPEVMKGQWATRTLDPSRLSEEIASGQDADVLCIESNYLQSGDARKLLWRYLSNGRGVILMVNRVTPAISGFLRELGFETEGTVQTPEGKPEKFQFVLSNHAIFHPFLSPEYGNLMDIRVFRYARLQSKQALPLVFSEHGAGLFFQGVRAQGKLFVTAFGLDREQTSWPVDQTFIPFLDLALQTARAEDPTPTAFEPGEISQVQLPTSSTVTEVILQNNNQVLSRAAVVQGRAQVRMPDRPGLYALTYDNLPQTQKIFSVNPSPKESQLFYADAANAMKGWQIAKTGHATKQGVALAKITSASVLQQRLWWWMVVGALGALLLEMIVAGTKRTQTT